jgi:hypothetical protein
MDRVYNNKALLPSSVRCFSAFIFVLRVEEDILPSSTT